MIYNSLALNKKNWNNLVRLKSLNRLPNALIFFGSEGTGKEGHAIEFAAYLNCKNISNDFSCGSCDSCIKVKSFQHGNIKLVLPLPKEKSSSKKSSSFDTLSDKNIKLLRKLFKKKVKDPYFKVELPQANQILINSIYELKKELVLSSAEEGYNVVLIFESEKLCLGTGSSGNALLKILEETPDHTLFILVTNSIEQILDTIISRCIKLYFKKLNDDEMHKILGNNINPENFKIISKIADGNAQFAKKILLSDELIKNYKFIYLELILKKKISLITKLIDIIYESKKKSYANLKLVFKIGLLIIKDCANYESPDILTKNELDEVLTKYPKTDWNKIIYHFDQTYKKIIENGNISLLVSGLIINIDDELK